MRGNRSMRVVVKDIVWDTEMDGEVIPQDELGLPSTMMIEEDIHEDVIADYLSDKCGYCVCSFVLEYTSAVDSPQSRKDKLFDGMIAHIQELVSFWDLRSTFHGIGFTDEELVEHEVGSARKVRFRNLLEQAGDDIQTGILFGDGTLACLCGCEGLFEEGDYEVLPDAE